MIIAVTAFGAEKLNKKQRHSQSMSAEHAREFRDNKTNTQNINKKNYINKVLCCGRCIISNI